MDFRVLPMAGAAALFVALISYLRWHGQINHAIGIALASLYRLLRDPKTFKVAETFCNEVAVLWFVFPLLDEIYEHWRDARNTPNQAQLPSLKIAFSVAALFFTFAIVLSHVGGGRTEE